MGLRPTETHEDRATRSGVGLPGLHFARGPTLQRASPAAVGHPAYSTRTAPAPLRSRLYRDFRRPIQAHQLTSSAPASIDPSRTSVFHVSASPGPKQPQSISLPERNAFHTKALNTTKSRAVAIE